MENVIIWKDINDTEPEEGQEILYTKVYQNFDGTWEYEVLIGTYTKGCRNNFPMCYMTYWTELPKAPIKIRLED